MPVIPKKSVNEERERKRIEQKQRRELIHSTVEAGILQRNDQLKQILYDVLNKLGAVVTQDDVSVIRNAFCSIGSRIVKSTLEEVLKETPHRHPLWPKFAAKYTPALRSDYHLTDQGWYPIWEAFLAGAESHKSPINDDYVDEEEEYDDEQY